MTTLDFDNLKLKTGDKVDVDYFTGSRSEGDLRKREANNVLYDSRDEDGIFFKTGVSVIEIPVASIRNITKK